MAKVSKTSPQERRRARLAADGAEAKRLLDLASAHERALKNKRNATPNETIKYIDEILDDIIKRPQMYDPYSIRAIELTIWILLDIRQFTINPEKCTNNGLGAHHPSAKKWLVKRYPHIPGGVRCISTATEEKLLAGADCWKFMSKELKAFVKYMKEEMGT